MKKLEIPVQLWTCRAGHSKQKTGSIVFVYENILGISSLHWSLLPIPAKSDLVTDQLGILAGRELGVTLGSQLLGELRESHPKSQFCKNLNKPNLSSTLNVVAHTVPPNHPLGALPGLQRDATAVLTNSIFLYSTILDNYLKKSYTTILNYITKVSKGRVKKFEK